MSSAEATLRREPPLGAHLPALDGLRACAVLLVLVTHARASSGSDLWSSRLVAVYGHLTYLGERGVELFFVLSGFLITGILLDLRGRPGRWSTFYARRTLRIFPLYYAFLAGFALTTLGSTDAGIVAWRHHQGWFWAYAQNWWNCAHPADAGFPWLIHFWTLAVEEQFYLAWPAIVWALPRRGLIVACIALACASPLARWYLASSGASAACVRQATFANLDALALGAIVAAAARGGGLLRLVAPARIGAAVAGGALLVALVMRHGELGNQPLAGTGFAILFASTIVLVATASPASTLARALAWRPMLHLGARSYAVYVFHQPLMLWMARVWPLHRHLPSIVNHLVFIVAALALSLVAAEISWRLLERPCLALKRLFPTSAPRPAVAPVAATPA